jgi:Fe-S cluster biosynthesis and repair protein YggX
MMTRTIFCHKLQTQAEGLEDAPCPGELGQRIYDHISSSAWALWIEQQTRLINEYRLNLAQAKSRQFLLQEMEKFLFGDGSAPPPGYTPPPGKTA